MTTIHISSINRKRPSLSAIRVWVKAPPASPAMYTATTWSGSDISHIILQIGYTHSTSESFRRIPHVIDPALMRNRCHSFSFFVSPGNTNISPCLLVVAIPVSNPYYFASIRGIILAFSLSTLYSRRERFLWRQKAPLRMRTTRPYCRQDIPARKNRQLQQCDSISLYKRCPIFQYQLGLVVWLQTEVYKSEDSRHARPGRGDRRIRKEEV